MADLVYRFSDGGRSNYYKGTANDYVVRSVAIAKGMDYKAVYKQIKAIVGYSPRNGIAYKDVHKAVDKMGGVWHPLMQVGGGCRHHLKGGEIPMDKAIICRLSGHLTAVVNGVNYDTFDPSRKGTRCVYGYWTFNK